MTARRAPLVLGLIVASTVACGNGSSGNGSTATAGNRIKVVNDEASAVEVQVCSSQPCQSSKGTRLEPGKYWTVPNVSSAAAAAVLVVVRGGVRGCTPPPPAGTLGKRTLTLP